MALLEISSEKKRMEGDGGRWRDLFEEDEEEVEEPRVEEGGAVSLLGVDRGAIPLKRRVR